MLSNERIYLRLMEEDDVPFKVKWINDEEFRRTLNFDYPISIVGTRQWLISINKMPSRKDFIVVDKESDSPIGYAGLLNIDLRTLKAESYLGIGEKEYQGKGLGREIRMSLLNYAFYQLGLNKVYSYVWDQNNKMIELNKKCGFKIEGLLREDIFSHGELRNRYIMGILKSDFIVKK